MAESPVASKSLKVVRKSAVKTRIDEDPQNMAALQDVQDDVHEQKKKFIDIEGRLQFLVDLTEKTIQRTLIIE